MKNKGITGADVIAVLILLAIIFTLTSARAAEPSRCPGWPPICHLNETALCLCGGASRSSCSWHCVHD